MRNFQSPRPGEEPMNAPSDRIDAHTAPESRRPWLEGFRALVVAAYGVDPWAEPEPLAPAPTTSITATSNASTNELTAWEEAFRLGQMRERLRFAGLDASVRAIAKETSSSAGRVGDLLHIYDSFPDADMLMLGLRTMSSDPSADTDVDDDLDAGLRRRAEAILKRLSFRTLREVSRLPDSFYRRVELIRIAAETSHRFAARS
jgi:hypothetical protein